MTFHRLSTPLFYPAHDDTEPATKRTKVDNPLPPHHPSTADNPLPHHPEATFFDPSMFAAFTPEQLQATLQQMPGMGMLTPEMLAAAMHPATMHPAVAAHPEQNNNNNNNNNANANANANDNNGADNDADNANTNTLLHPDAAAVTGVYGGFDPSALNAIPHFTGVDYLHTLPPDQLQAFIQNPSTFSFSQMFLPPGNLHPNSNDDLSNAAAAAAAATVAAAQDAELLQLVTDGELRQQVLGTSELDWDAMENHFKRSTRALQKRFWKLSKQAGIDAAAYGVALPEGGDEDEDGDDGDGHQHQHHMAAMAFAQHHHNHHHQSDVGASAVSGLQMPGGAGGSAPPPPTPPPRAPSRPCIFPPATTSSAQKLE